MRSMDEHAWAQELAGIILEIDSGVRTRTIHMSICIVHPMSIRIRHHLLLAIHRQRHVLGGCVDWALV